MELHLIAPYAVPLLALAASYGALHTRIKAVEHDIEHTVSRHEFEALSRRLDEVVAELKGLRADLIAVIKERVR